MMEDTKALRRFFLVRFIIALLMVGMTQAIINLAMGSAILPGLERAIGLEGILSGKSLTEAIRIFFSCLLLLISRAILGEGSLVEGIANSKLGKSLFGEASAEAVNSLNMGADSAARGLMAFKVVVFFVLLVLIWVLPYVICAILYSFNVSNKVYEIERIRRQREKEYEKRRNLLLSDITHDIKTPITTMAGFSKALADGTVPEEQRQSYLDSVYNKSMTVSNLVTLLFEYIKLDSTGYVLNRTELDFSELVRECAAGVYTEFEEKKIEPRIVIPERKLSVYVDKMQLERAINNLLTNTVKHNAEGAQVTISVSSEGGYAVFRVSDNGERIEKEDAIHIFEPFVRGDKSRKSGTGNGLGLSISKKITEMHGGRIMLIQYRDPEKYHMTKTFEIRIPLS